jgi:uncharacterized protein (DUF488 family)
MQAIPPGRGSIGQTSATALVELPVTPGPGPTASPWIATIGYEGLPPEAFLRLLRDAGIRRVVDVRALANSRRPGYAKRALTAALTGVGIAYSHLPALGTPAAGREAVRSGRIAAFRTIYATHLAGGEAQAALAGLAATARGEKVCLLCLEADPEHCHRTIIAAQLADEAGFTVAHLRQ